MMLNGVPNKIVIASAIIGNHLQSFAKQISRLLLFDSRSMRTEKKIELASFDTNIGFQCVTVRLPLTAATALTFSTITYHYSFFCLYKYNVLQRATEWTRARASIGSMQFNQTALQKTQQRQLHVFICKSTLIEVH